MRSGVVLQQPRDPGLQAERTALAWNRTGLAVLVNALLALRSGWSSGDRPIIFLAVALLVAAGAAVFYGAWRRRQLLSARVMIAPPAIGIVAVAVVALLTCLVGTLSIFLN